MKTAVQGRPMTRSLEFHSPVLQDGAIVALLLLGMIAVLCFAWVGYLGSDDVTYAAGAYGWLREFPYVGGHGTIRYLITVPIAVSFTIFGEGEFQLVLPTIVYFAALIAFTYLFASRLLDRATAIVAAVLLTTFPLFAVQATTASADITEMTYIALSVWLFAIAPKSPRPLLWLFLSGAAAGLAWLTRETTVALVLFYGLAFVVGYHIHRLQYFVVGAGFLAIWGCELVYLYAMTGDPLYRIFISLHHDATVTREIDVAGNLFVHPALNPILMLLVNQEFGAFFWVGVPLIILALVRPRAFAPHPDMARLWAAVAFVWFMFFAVNSTLLPLNPRYATPTAYGAIIVTAIFLRRLWLDERRLHACIVLAGLLLTNGLAIHVENRDYMFGERALADFVHDRNEPVLTDPETRHRAEQMLQWQQTDSLVTAGMPSQGMLYLYNPTRAGHPSRFVTGQDLSRYRPKADWQVVWTASPEPKTLGRVLKALGLDGIIPGSVMRRLYLPHPGVTVYRVPAG